MNTNKNADEEGATQRPLVAIYALLVTAADSLIRVANVSLSSNPVIRG